MIIFVDIWKDVVIRPFDKGVGFFLLGEEEYIQRIGVHLNDRSVYSIFIYYLIVVHINKVLFY